MPNMAAAPCIPAPVGAAALPVAAGDDELLGDAEVAAGTLLLWEEPDEVAALQMFDGIGVGVYTFPWALYAELQICSEAFATAVFYVSV